MSVDYIAGNTTDGLTLKLYRGEDMVLLGFVERRETYPARGPRQHAFTHPAVPVGACSKRSA